jgi:hypothetical protein
MEENFLAKHLRELAETTADLRRIQAIVGSSPGEGSAPRLPSQGGMFNAPREDVTFNAPREDVTFDAPRKSARFSASNEGVRFSAPREDVMFNAHREGVRTDTPKQGVRFNSSSEGFTFNAPREGFTFSAPREDVTVSEPRRGFTFTGNAATSNRFPVETHPRHRDLPRQTINEARSIFEMETNTILNSMPPQERRVGGTTSRGGDEDVIMVHDADTNTPHPEPIVDPYARRGYDRAKHTSQELSREDLRRKTELEAANQAEVGLTMRLEANGRRHVSVKREARGLPLDTSDEPVRPPNDTSKIRRCAGEFFDHVVCKQKMISPLQCVAVARRLNEHCLMYLLESEMRIQIAANNSVASPALADDVCGHVSRSVDLIEKYAFSAQKGVCLTENGIDVMRHRLRQPHSILAAEGYIRSEISHHRLDHSSFMTCLFTDMEIILRDKEKETSKRRFLFIDI